MKDVRTSNVALQGSEVGSRKSEVRPSSMEVRAYAKVNLSLDVLGVRPDGFHDLRTVMHTVSLHDTLTLFTGADGFDSEGGSGDGDHSSIDRAIAGVLTEAGVEHDVSYRLTKRIPAAAGLGGGSSDAAAAILALNRLLGLNLSPRRLQGVAAGIGCDVPFFLSADTALIEGRGERVFPLSAPRITWFLLANEGRPVSTKCVFEAHLEADRNDGRASDRVLEAIERGEIVLGGNDLVGAALRRFPEVESSFATLSQVAPEDRIGMSGSGGTVFAIFATEPEAREAYSALRGSIPWLCVAGSVERPRGDIVLP